MEISDLKQCFKDLKISKKTSKKILVYFENPDKIAKLNTALYKTRLYHKHKMVSILDKGTRGYGILFWIHPIIEQLCETYQRDYDQMAHLYLSLGIKKMVRGYGINKYKYYNEDILTDIDHRMKVEKDEEPDVTRRLFKYYSKKVFEKYDVELTTLTIEDKYHLIKLREFIRSRELNAKEWIDSVFNKNKKQPPIFVFYGQSEEGKEEIDIKHSKLAKIIKG